MVSRLAARMRWVAVASLVAASAVEARPLRPRFEPTDLELEVPGTLEVDVQVGYVDATPTSRVVLPDFELDLGLTKRFELDLDGEYSLYLGAIDGSHPETLWLSGKVGLFDVVLPSKLTLAGGVQVGPRIAGLRAIGGVGVDGLVLFGLTYGRVQLAGNVGGYWDPTHAQNDGTRKRPRGVQLGGSVDVDLTRDRRWSFHVEVGATVSLAVDPNQLVLAAGIVLAPTRSLEVSLLGLVGLLPGSDRAGALLGAAPKILLWR